MYLFLGTLNQYSGRIFFLPYDIIGVVFGIRLLFGLPILSRKYNGGSSQDLAGLGISSVKKYKSLVLKVVKKNAFVSESYM